jgi:hypothetical protein
MSYTYAPPLPRSECNPEQHAKEGGCAWCCERCNYDRHICLFCGDSLTHDEKLPDGSSNSCYMSEDELKAYLIYKGKP